MDLKRYIRDVPDFPKDGIVFKDITPLLQNGDVFEYVIDTLYKRYKDANMDAIVSAESRGFIFGAPLATKLGIGFVPVRKPGKLPYKTIEASYELEYGTDTLQMHEDAISDGENILIIDDLLATGGTTTAMIELVKKLGGNIREICYLIELGFLDGRKRLDGYPIYSLIKY